MISTLYTATAKSSTAHTAKHGYVVILVWHPVSTANGVTGTVLYRPYWPSLYISTSPKAARAKRTASALTKAEGMTEQAVSQNHGGLMLLMHVVPSC